MGKVEAKEGLTAFSVRRDILSFEARLACSAYSLNDTALIGRDP